MDIACGSCGTLQLGYWPRARGRRVHWQKDDDHPSDAKKSLMGFGSPLLTDSNTSSHLFRGGHWVPLQRGALISQVLAVWLQNNKNAATFNTENGKGWVNIGNLLGLHTRAMLGGREGEMGVYRASQTQYGKKKSYHTNTQGCVCGGGGGYLWVCVCIFSSCWVCTLFRIYQVLVKLLSHKRRADPGRHTLWCTN